MCYLEIKDDDVLRPDECRLYFDTLEGFENVTGPYIELPTGDLVKWEPESVEAS